MQVKVIEKYTAFDLELNKFFKRGWGLKGDMIVTADKHGRGCCYSQMLIKEEI